MSYLSEILGIPVDFEALHESDQQELYEVLVDRLIAYFQLPGATIEFGEWCQFSTREQDAAVDAARRARISFVTEDACIASGGKKAALALAKYEGGTTLISQAASRQLERMEEMTKGKAF